MFFDQAINAVSYHDVMKKIVSVAYTYVNAKSKQKIIMS